MNLNIEFQCAGLVILVMIMFLFVRTKRIGVTNSRRFFIALLACFLCEALDIASIVGIYHATYRGMDPVIAKAVCKLYVMSLVLQGYQGFLYASSEILAAKRSTWLRHLFACVFVASEVLIAISRIEYYMDGRQVYSYGPATLWTYVAAVSYILATIGVSFAGREIISARRRYAMLIWQGCWLVAAAIQFLVPELLVVGFAAALGMMILYSQLENPNEFIDRNTGCFTRSALAAYIHDRYVHGKHFSMFFVRIRYLIEADHLLQQNAVMRSAKAMLGLTGDPVFYLDDGKFVLVYDDAEKMEDSRQRLEAMARTVKDVPAEPRYVVVPDSRSFESPEEVMHFIHAYEESDEEEVVADEHSIAKLREMQQIHDLIDTALREDRVEVFYQPFYNADKKRFTAAEALVRIREKDGSLVPPGKFIPVAERSGQIRSLGIRIFEKVCIFLATGKAQALGLEYIEVNLSAVQFDRENPAGFVQAMMQEYGIKPEWINLEITETAEAEVQQIMLLNMNKLSEIGIAFSLDDFGTGRANLDYFVTMPLKNVKFDYSFTQGYFNDEKVRRVVSGMVQVIHDMGMQIVSEGVETDEQLNGMLELGADYIQGFCFSKPIPEKEFLEFLEKRNGLTFHGASTVGSGTLPSIVTA